VRARAGGAGAEQRDVDARRVGGRDVLDDDRLPPNSTAVPAERAVANRRSSRIGNERSARISRMTVPTWPVAPTTATESPESEMRVMGILAA
jgi:hypothetical protein